MAEKSKTGAIWIDGVPVVPTMLTLRPFEAGFLLETTERSVRQLLRQGRIENASRDATKRIAVEDVCTLVEERIEAGRLTPLARYVLLEVLTGRLRVHRSQIGSGAPASLASLALPGAPLPSRSATTDSLHRSTSIPRSSPRHIPRAADAT
ncbi:MAG: hypothetical protein ACR2G3_12625 [Solirubrobacterales bacterium]